MPAHDLGYRAWVGKRMTRFLRPLVVAEGGISLVWRRKALRWMLIFSWLPITLFGLGVFFYEYAGTNEEIRPAIAQAVTMWLGRPDLGIELLTDYSSARHDVWASIILAFFRVPQLLAMVLLVGLIAPMLISYDLRSKAYLMYFSRPLSPLEYIVGKSAVIWFFLSMITAVPAIALYVVAIFMSPDLSVVYDTWDIPLRILGATVVLVVPTTALALCYSSFTSESRYASFSWFATWAMGFVAYQVLTFAGTRMERPRRRPRGPRFGDADPGTLENSVPEAIRYDGPEFLAQRGFGPGGPRRRGRGFDVEDLEAIQFDRQSFLDTVDLDRWRLLSPYHTLGKVEAWVFGLDTSDGSVWPAVIVLVAITVGCVWLIRNRIVARLRV